MKKIFIGLIFLFLDLNLQGINLMPSFVGYIFIFLGLDEEYECPSLNASRTIAFASAIIMGGQWVAGVFGYGMTFPIGAILQLLMTYRLVRWAEEQAEEQNWSGAQTRRFRVSWYAMAGAVIAAALLNWLSPAMGLVWSVVALAAVIYYIYAYYKLWKSAAPEESGE